MFFFSTFGQCCWVGVVASPHTCNLYVPGKTPGGGIFCVHFFSFSAFLFFFFQTDTMYFTAFTCTILKTTLTDIM